MHDWDLPTYMMRACMADDIQTHTQLRRAVAGDLTMSEDGDGAAAKAAWGAIAGCVAIPSAMRATICR